MSRIKQKIAREMTIAKKQKKIDKSPMGYRKSNQLICYNPYKRAYGSFESNTR